MPRMSFDTITFWTFFAVAWALWRWLPFGLAKTSALILSLVFYGWWDPRYIVLIIGSSLVDYHAGHRIHESTSDSIRRGWLALSITCNLGLLAIFKYAPFANENVARLAELLGLDGPEPLTDWVIPVGISFYTFQTLSYSIDIYRRNLKPTESLRDFLLFVSFYPQLVAGPIVRAKDLLPQLEHRRRLLPAAVQMGLYYVIVGLFLKIVVADNLALPINAAFRPDRLPNLSPCIAWLAMVYFAFQILADFAGYSGIAIGLAYLLGLRFPRNFNYPYIAGGLSEFWTRWHISLSQWLRDYLYISLGGNRKGLPRMMLALMLTMVIGGLWHGPSWNFVAWGTLHGIGLCVERALRGNRRKAPTGAPKNFIDFALRLVRIAVVFVFILVTWVFFRASDFEAAMIMLERMWIAPFTEDFGLERLANARHLLLILPIVLLHIGQLSHEWYGVRKTAWRRAFVAAACLAALIIVRRGAPQEFIYFQF